MSLLRTDRTRGFDLDISCDEDRVRIAITGWFQIIEMFQHVEIQLFERHFHVGGEGLTQILPLEVFPGDPFQTGNKPGKVFVPDRETRRGGMTSVTDEQVLALVERVGDVEFRDGATRAARLFGVLGGNDGGTIIHFCQA